MNRAEIAELFIKVGFEYLKEMQRRYIREDDALTINKALDEAFFLVDQFRPLDERKYVSILDRPKQ